MSRGLGAVALVVSGCVRATLPTDAAAPCPEIHGPPFPEAAHLTVRRSTEANMAPFSRCSLFPGSLGADACAGPWSGTIFEDGTGVAGAAWVFRVYFHVDAGARADA